MMNPVKSGTPSKPKSGIIRSNVTVILMMAAVLALSCSDDDKSPTSTGKRNSISNNIAFMYDQIHELTMGSNYAICCGPWEEGYDDTYTLKIFIYDSSFEESFWKLFIAVNEVVVDSLYTLPSTDSPFQLFSVDVDTSNELASNTLDSSGEIRFEQFDCGPPLKISFTIDAVVASEYWDMPSVNVTGSFSCTIYSNPSPFGCDFSM